MVKRILTSILVLASLAAIIYTIWGTRAVSDSSINGLSHVPRDARAILHVEDASLLFDRLAQGNLLWEELSRSDVGMRLSAWTSSLDSALSRTGNKSSFTWSIHPSGADRMDWLLSVPVNHIRLRPLDKLVTDQGYSAIEEKTYGGEQYQVLSNGDELIHLMEVEERLFISPSGLILEALIRDEGNGIMSAGEFMDAWNVHDDGALASLFIDHRQFRTLFSSLPTGISLPLGGGWSASEIGLDAKTLFANGLLSVQDTTSSSGYSLPMENTASLDGFLEFIPSSSSYYILEQINQGPKWLDNQAGRVNIYPSCRAEPCPDPITVWRLDDLEAAMKTLTDEQAANQVYRGALLYELTPGLLIDGESIGYACILGDYLLTSVGSFPLRTVLDDILTGRHLANDEHFEAIDEYISDSPYHHLHVHMSGLGARASGLFDQGDSKNNWEELHDLVWQMEPAKDGWYHINGFLRHDPNIKEEAGSLMEISLPNPSIGSPTLVRNHYTDELEISIQDSSHTFRLFGSTGKELWSLELDGPIISEVHQLDMFKNGKLQMLFNTATKMYLIDRKGRHVEGWPVSLVDSASCGLALMDYDSNRNYRILMPLVEGSLLNYDVSGKAVDGWQHGEESDFLSIYRGAVKDPIVSPPTHYVIGKKDYILCQHQSGHIRFLARDGHARFSPELLLKNALPSQTTLIAGRTIEESILMYRTNTGSIRSMAFFGTDEERLGSLDGPTLLTSAGHFIRVDGDRILLYSDLNQKAAEIELSHSVSALAETAEGFVFLWDDTEGVTSLIDPEGVLLKGGPFPGKGSGCVGDMNLDGSTDIIMESLSGNLVVFSLQD